MGFIDGATRTFPNNAALGRGIRVTVSAGYLAAAGAGVDDVGVMEFGSLAGDETAAVRLPNASGTCQMVAAAAITALALVYSAASGKISGTPAGKPIGLALEAASADNDIIEVLRFSTGTDVAEVETKTADYTVTAADSGKAFSTAGTSATVTFAMPAATPGMKYRFRVGTAQELRIDPNGTETISLPSTGVPGAAGKYLTANAAGETVDIQCDVAGTWSVYGFTGTWTAEA